MTRRLALTTALVTLAACGGDAPNAEAPPLRPVTTFRQWHGEDHIDARVQLSHGSLHVVPGQRDELYRLTAAYGADKAIPVDTFDPTVATLHVRQQNGGGERTDSTAGGLAITFGDDDRGTPASTTLALSPAVNAALELELVGMESDVELGGLRLTALEVEAAAGQTTIRFSRPNAANCAQATIIAGLSQLSVVGLGNTRCNKTTIQSFAATVLLDFSGSWPASTTMGATIVVGTLKLRLPRNVGVRLTSHELFSDLAPQGLVREGHSFVSPGYESAARQLNLDVTAAIGGTSIEWIGE